MVCGNQIYTHTQGLPNTCDVCCTSVRALNGERLQELSGLALQKGKGNIHLSLMSEERERGERRSRG